METDQVGRLRDILEAARLIGSLHIVWEVATVHVREICGVLESFFAHQP